MTQLAYQTVSTQKHLLTKSGGLCTSCCTYRPKTILHISGICQLNQINGFPTYNLQDNGYWNAGVAVGYSYWRVYTLMLPDVLSSGTYPRAPEENWGSYYALREWRNLGAYRIVYTGEPIPGRNYWINWFYSGSIRADGMLLWLPQYLCHPGIAQYVEGTSIPVCFASDIKLCVSANGTDWPTL